MGMNDQADIILVNSHSKGISSAYYRDHTAGKILLDLTFTRGCQSGMKGLGPAALTT